MILAILSFLVPLLSLCIGAFLINRAMRRAGEHVDPSCAVCGQAGKTFTSFQCPGCGHDVRERGLIVRRGRTPAGVLFVACTLALVVTVAAAIGLAVISQNGWLPPVHSFSVQVGFSPTAWLPQKFRSIEVTTTGLWRETGFRQGRAWLDLKLPDGAISTMEIDLANHSARIVPADGGKPVDAGTLDRNLLERWMDESGVAASDARRRYLDEFIPLLKVTTDDGTLPRHPMEVMKTAIMVGGGGGATVDAPREQWQLIAITAPLVWLAVSALVLSCRPKRGAAA